MQKLIEKANIDWNNYLTPEEVKTFLQKDDKTESAENIIYDRAGNFYKNYFQDFKEQGWTRPELVSNLVNFYNNQHLNENKISANIILYHGSSNPNLTTLDIGKSVGSGDQYGKGIYLTTEYDEAKSYAGNKGKVYKVTLDTDLNLYNLNDKLSDNIKQQIIKELSSSKNRDIKNYMCMFNRKIYDVEDKKIGLKFYQDKQKEWLECDNKYFGNMPKITRTETNLQIIYTDYNVNEAIENMTGENLLDTLSGDVDPEIFVTIIVSSGYDGIVTHSGKWYVIYKNIDKVHILKETKYFYGHKLEEVSRNELLVKTKGETITRYNKAAGYRGFSIANIDTSHILNDNSLVITCKVGKYNTVVELEEILYWIEVVAENTKSYTPNQVNTKVVTQAIMNSIDGLNIKVDCECGDWVYRMAYQATQWGYKYGKPENRPANIRNPQGYGALCKHLTSILGNKRWLQQVTSTVLNWVEANIDAVNKFLGLSGDKVLTLPNELARQNAKLSWQNRRNKDDENEENDTENQEQSQENNSSNVEGNNPSTNTINNKSNINNENNENSEDNA